MNKTLFTTDQVKEMVMDSLMTKFKDSINASYSSPITPIIAEVINENKDKIKKEFQEALDSCFGDKEFTKIIRQEFKHKVAKNLVGKLEGEVERAVEAIRQDQTMRARMILAVERIIKSETI